MPWQACIEVWLLLQGLPQHQYNELNIEIPDSGMDRLLARRTCTWDNVGSVRTT